MSEQSLPPPPPPPVHKHKSDNTSHDSIPPPPKLDLARSDAPPPPPPMGSRTSPTRATRATAQSATKSKAFQFSRGDPNKVDWEHIEDIKVSEAGAGGVAFVNSKGNGTVVIKGSATVVKDYFATLIAQQMKALVAHMRIVDYSNPSGEWMAMLSHLKKFFRTRESDYEARKIKKEIRERCFIEVMEMVTGKQLGSLTNQEMNTAFGGDSSMSISACSQLGRIIALDVLLNNWDRFPVIWENQGNFNNIIVDITNNEITVTGIDNGYSFIDPTVHTVQHQKYIHRVEAFLASLCHATEAGEECQELTRVRTALEEATGLFLPRSSSLWIQRGILQGFVDICSTISNETLSSLIENVRTAIIEDWCNIWTSGMLGVQPSFILSVRDAIETFEPRLRAALSVKPAEKNLETLSSFAFKVLVMQSQPQPLVQAVEEFERVMATLQGTRVDMVIYPEGWNISNTLGAADLTNDRVAAFSSLAKKYNIYILPGTTLEKSKQSLYQTAAVLNRQGHLIGTYRKRRPVALEHISPGDQNFLFEIPELGGKAAVMICFDIENTDILAEVLAERPVLILNPVHIPDSSASAAANPKLVEQSWRTAVDFMRRKFEKIALDNDIDIIRCDMPRPHGNGSSQVITACRTVPGISPAESFFVVELFPRNSPNRKFQGSAPARERTMNEDNTQNRYFVRSIPNHTGFLKQTTQDTLDLVPTCAISLDTTKPSAAQPSARIVLGFKDGSIRIWDRISTSFSALAESICPLSPSRGAVKAFARLSDTLMRATWADDYSLTFDTTNAVWTEAKDGESSSAGSPSSSQIDLQSKEDEIVHMCRALSSLGTPSCAAWVSSHIAAIATSSGSLVLFDTDNASILHTIPLSTMPLSKVFFNIGDLYILVIDTADSLFCVEFTQNNFAASPTNVFNL